MPANRLLFQLVPSMPRTGEIESGLWATPRTTDVTGGPRKLDEQGRRISQTNPDLKFGANLADQVKMWPTPTAQDAKNNGGESQHSRNTKPLNAEIGGALNPQWVEWLMGYPEGWTDLKD